MSGGGAVNGLGSSHSRRPSPDDESSLTIEANVAAAGSALVPRKSPTRTAANSRQDKAGSAMPSGRVRERTSTETAAAIGAGGKRLSGTSAAFRTEWNDEARNRGNDVQPLASGHSLSPTHGISARAKPVATPVPANQVLEDRGAQLIDAVRENDLPAARELLRRGVPVKAAAPRTDWALLHVACAEGRGSAEMVQMLISHGADANAQTTQGLTPLHFCAVEGFVDAARALLDGGAEVNMLDHDGMTPLLRACVARRDDAALARLLLSRGTMVEFRDEEGWNLLHMSARYGLERVAELLLKEFDADVDAAMPANAWTPLMLCCSEGAGSERILQMLLGAGADPDARSDLGVTALHMAAYNEFPWLVRRLVDAGAKVDARDAAGRCALHKACLAGACRAAEALLAAGADPAAEDDEQRTPLHYASSIGSPTLAQLLLGAAEERAAAERESETAAAEAQRQRRAMRRAARAVAGAATSGESATLMSVGEASAEPGISDAQPHACTALAAEGARSRHSSCSDAWSTDDDSAEAQSPLQLLGAARPAGAALALVNAADAQGRTPLIECCDARAPSVELAELLLARGADVASADRNEATALCHAAGNKFTALATALLARGADVNHPDEACQTPLLLALAVPRGAAADLALLQLLRAHGADADRQDCEGACALGLCARSNLLEAAELLLRQESGQLHRTPRPDLRDDAGRTPFLVACALGHTDLAQLLLRHGSADAGQTDARGNNAVRLACQGGHADTLRFLLEDVGCALPSDGASAAALADLCALPSPRAALQLLDAGADTDASCVNVAGSSTELTLGAPLLAAVRFAHVPVVERLLKLDKAQRRFKGGVAAKLASASPLADGVCPRAHALRTLPSRARAATRCSLCRGAASDEATQGAAQFRCCDACAFAVCKSCRDCAAAGGGVDVRKFAAAVNAPQSLQQLLSRAFRNVASSSSSSNSSAHSASSAASSVSRTSDAQHSPAASALPPQLREALRARERPRSMLSRLACARRR